MQASDEVDAELTDAQVGACLNSQQPQQGAPGTRQRSPLALFDIVLHLTTSPVFRPKIVTPLLIRELSRYIVIAWNNNAPAAAAAPEFRDALMHVLEALCQPPDLLVVYCESITDELLPALCQVRPFPSPPSPILSAFD